MSTILFQVFGYSLGSPAYSLRRPRNIYPYNDFDINLDGYFQFHTVPRIILVHIYFARVYYKVFEMILQDISMVPRNIYMSINSCPRILLYYSILYDL
jgi:hypothetical protein